MEQDAKKGLRFWWLALLLPLCCLPCLFPATFFGGSDPYEFMDSVPDNSKLSELDGYIGDFSRWTRVCAWTREKPANSTAWPQEYKGLGTFYETELGSYQDWGASKQVRDRFSGTIDFRHGSSINLDSYAPTYTVTLVYIDGVLRDKRLHRHPG